MEAETPEPKVIAIATVASQEVKREILQSTMLLPYLQGENKLSYKVGRQIPLRISETSARLFLDRLMKEKTKKSIDHTMDMQLVQPNLASFLNVDEAVISKLPANHVQLRLVFEHFAWPRDAEWTKFEMKHRKLLTQGEGNRVHVEMATKKKKPLDIGYVTFTNTAKREKKIIRFIVHRPVKENAIGIQLMQHDDEPEDEEVL